MTTIKPGGEPLTSPLAAVRSRRKGTVIAAWLSSTDHKVIGYMYFITSFPLFALAGVMALVIRAEPAQPGMQVVTQEAYNQLLTMHDRDRPDRDEDEGGGDEKVP